MAIIYWRLFECFRYKFKRCLDFFLQKRLRQNYLQWNDECFPCSVEKLSHRESKIYTRLDANDRPGIFLSSRCSYIWNTMLPRWNDEVVVHFVGSLNVWDLIIAQTMNRPEFSYYKASTNPCNGFTTGVRPVSWFFTGSPGPWTNLGLTQYIWTPISLLFWQTIYLLYVL